MSHNYKIAVIQSTVSRNAGGLFYSVKNLMKKLRETNSQIKVFTKKDEFYNQDSITWSPLEIFAIKESGLIADRFSTNLKLQLLKYDASLIHVHGIWDFPTQLAHFVFKKNNTPYLISPRGMLDPWALNNSRLKKLIALALFEKRNLKAATCIHALNDSEYRSIRKFGLKNPVAIIPNGISLQPEPTSLSTKKMEKKKLLFLGRIHPKKGISLLIESINSIKRSVYFSSKEWEIIIAGWDQNGYRKKLETLVAQYQLESVIKFLGPVYGTRKHELLSSVQGFILPSYSEGLPMSVLEAFSYGVPVLMTKECNLPKAFDLNAAIEIHTDTNDISKKLLAFFSLNNEQLEKLQTQGYKYAKDNFSWDFIAKQMEEVYNWILNSTEKPHCVILD